MIQRTFAGMRIVLLLAVAVGAHFDSNGNGFKFVGDEHWAAEYRKQCDTSKTRFWSKDLHCFTRVRFPERVNSEVLAWDPVLIVFRGFATPTEIEGFLTDVKRKQLAEQRVVDYKAVDGQSTISNARRANGSWIPHEEGPGIRRLFKKAQRLIPNVNFRISESWQVLSYHPGGHYAPHHDYLNYESKAQWDYWMNNFGNRYATFLLVLKTADEGGGTVFPLLNTTVRPGKGDVIFWTNMKPNGKIAQTSLHGACPIYEGQKIAATLWIRQKDQPILNAEHSIFDPKAFLSTKRVQTCPLTRLT